MSDREVKQVIVVRTKYPDGKGGITGIRAGKIIAQACHASLAFITRQLQHGDKVSLSKAAKQWIDSSFAKICCRVNSEEELLEVLKKAKEEGLEVHLITDSGKTEFANQPTKTCLAIGPDWADKIDKITGKLELY